MKTILSLALLTLSSSAFAASDCSIKVYAKGVMIKSAQPTLYKPEVSCAATANSIINGSFGLIEGKPDAVEFSYTTDAGDLIKGSLQK